MFIRSLWLSRYAGMLAVVTLLLGLPPTALARTRADLSSTLAARALTAEPSSDSCPIPNQRQVTVRGSGFTPGVGTRFTLTRNRDGAITAANTAAGGQPIAADGTYASTIPLVGCGPDEPVGTTFTITVTEYTPDRTPVNGLGASAVFTVTAPGVLPGLPNTGGGGAQRHASPVPDPAATLYAGLIAH